MTTSTNDHTSSQAWAGARGDQWRAHLDGMEAMLAPVDEPLIEALRLDAPCTIADVGCGGGGATLAIARRSPPGSVVRGVDISPSLIELARTRPRPDERAVTFEVADMTTAPPPSVLCDRLASRFGVMFFDDPAAAFASMARWLAPGGRLAFAVWGRSDDNPWQTVVREVVSAHVEVPPPPPGAPGPFRYADPAPLLELLAGAGFRDLGSREWRGDLPIGGGLPVADAARFVLSAFSTFDELLRKAGGDARESAERALAARLAGHQREGAVWLGASVNIVTGVRA